MRRAYILGTYMRRAHITVALLAGGSAASAAAVAACGREDVVLVDVPSVTATDGGDEASDDGGSLGDGMRGDGAGCPDAPSTVCRTSGDTCASAQDCCSDRCENAICLPAACGAPGAACTARDQCCSGACEPVPGTPNRACLGYCKRLGTACSRAQDCCSLACLGGVCAAGVCARTGDDCVLPSDCCSRKCTTGRCELDTVLSCRPSGEDCNSGGGVGCCGPCNQDQRCDVGPGACRGIGAPCLATSDCCRGTCARVSNQTPLVCMADCVAEGATCATSAECCAGSCSGSPSTCRAQADSCKLLGADCTTDRECCSAQCLGGRCGDNCSGPR